MRMKLIPLVMIIAVVLFVIYIDTKGIVTKAPYPMELRPPQEVIEPITKRPPKRITVVIDPCRIILETRRLTVKRGTSATLRLTLIGTRNETTTVYLIASYGEDIPSVPSILYGLTSKEKLFPVGMRASFDKDKIILSKGEKVKVNLNIWISPAFKKGVHVLAITTCTKWKIGHIGTTKFIELYVKE